MAGPDFSKFATFPSSEFDLGGSDDAPKTEAEGLDFSEFASHVEPVEPVEPVDPPVEVDTPAISQPKPKEFQGLPEAQTQGGDRDALRRQIYDLIGVPDPSLKLAANQEPKPTDNGLDFSEFASHIEASEDVSPSGEPSMPPSPGGLDFTSQSQGAPKATFGESMSRGTDKMQAMLYGWAEATGEITGIEGVRDFGREGRESNLREMQQSGIPAQSKITEADGWSDYLQWAKEMAGDQIPIMAPSLAGAAVGTALGSLGGPVGMTIGGALGAFIPSAGLGTGEVQMGIKEKDPGVVAPGYAFAGGTAIGFLDSILPTKIGGKLGRFLVGKFGKENAERIARHALIKPVRKKYIKTLAKNSVSGRVGRGFAKGMATEGITEAIQEAIAEVAAAKATNQEVDFDAMIEQMIEAGAAGALFGGFLGGGTAVFDTPKKKPITGDDQKGIGQQRKLNEPRRDKVAREQTSQSGFETPDVINQPGPTQTGTVPEDFITPEPASPGEAESLKAQGWSDQDIQDMTPAQRAEEIQDYQEQVSQTPVSPTLAEDTPTAEPFSDIAAQIKDLKSPESQRQAIWLAPDTIGNLDKDKVAAAKKAGVAVDNFDGEGGVLIAQDKQTAKAAVKARDQGLPAQTVIGRLTGAGDGKPVDASAVVQQRDETGAVTQESAVRDDQVAETVQRLSEPGKTVEVKAPAQAIEERAERVDQETALETVAEAETIQKAAEETIEPSEAQAESGNYKKGHVKFQGMDVSIETAKGGTRSKIKDGKTVWAVPNMPAHYGYIKRTEGADGDHVDVFIGDNPKSDTVFVIDQIDPHSGAFDEHKAVLGANSVDEAAEIYAESYSDGLGPDRIDAITEMSVGEFKDWLKEGDTKSALGRGEPDIEPGVQIAEDDEDIKAEDEIKQPRAAYSGPELSETEVDLLVSNWNYVRDVARLPKPESLSAWVIRNGGLEDVGGEVTNLIGSAKGRPGLLNSQGMDLDAATEAAWDAGYLSSFSERPEINDFLALLDDDLRTNDIFSTGNEDYLENVAIAGELEQELFDYGIEGFRTERSLRQWLGQDVSRGSEASGADTRNEATSQAEEDTNQAIPFDLGQKPDESVDGEETKTSEDWLQTPDFQNVTILDPDGWRGSGKSLNDQITRSEFEKRLVASTIKLGVDQEKAAKTDEIKNEKPDVFTEDDGQTSLVKGATDKEKIDAETNKPLRGGNEPIDEGLFGSEKDQTDLVDLAKKAKAKDAVVDPALTAKEMGREAATNDGSRMPMRNKAFVDLVDGLDKDTQKKLRIAFGEGFDARRAEIKSEAQDTKADKNIDTKTTEATKKSDKPETKTQDDVAKKADEKKETLEAEMKAMESDSADIKSGETDPAAKSDDVLSDRFAAHFRDGKSFDTIVQARKFAKQAGFALSNKEVDEAVEIGVVKLAREIAANGTLQPDEVFSSLVNLYDLQPNLSTRTDTSMANQAYSTPVPLGYLASRLADVRLSESVLEPTAGNGALLIEANPGEQIVHVNELEENRHEALKAQGFEATGKDAADVKTFASMAGGVGSVVMNPPFGTVRQGGKTKSFAVEGLNTTQIDHAIALNALKAMADDGKAVLILGGVKDTKIEARRKGYRGKAKREFYHKLYNGYNVLDHFTISGDLYKKQGASFPVDVVVIEGRSTSERKLPAASPPEILTSWADVGAKLEGQDNGTGTAVTGKVDTQRNLSEQGGEKDAGATKGDKGQKVRDGDGGTQTVGERSGRSDGGSGSNTTNVRDGTNRDQSKSTGDAGSGRTQVTTEGSRSDRDSGRSDHSDTASQRQSGVSEAETSKASPLKAKPSKVKPLKGKDSKTNEAGQVTYRPSSKVKGMNSLMPVNMRGGTEAALNRIEDRFGAVDTYVADRLGYKKSELSKAFAAEQVDALAAAIDNVERGAAIVIGDQTGLGKGRIVAGMLRYALRNDMVPVMVTEKPDLYGDMYRDLTDINVQGMLGRDVKMFMTNNDGKAVPLDDRALDWIADSDEAKLNGEKRPPKKGRFLKPFGTSSKGKKAHSQAMMDIAEGKADYDIVFTTYDQMNTVAGKTTERRQFLTSIAPNALIVMDESHNAGGQGSSAWAKKDAAQNRAEFARELTASARGVVYSSATYAKHPRVMDLYARTDMGKAVEDPKQLPELIQKGGVPMQQVVAGMLADSGQYVRRERSFDGIDYNLTPVPVDREGYNGFAGQLRAIFRFDLQIAKEREQILKDRLDETGGVQTKDGGVGDASAYATSFGSIMHNIVSQFLLAIKADPVADRVIEALKKGEKPTVALSNTMESFVKDYADAADIKNGDAINVSFRDVLQRYLERTLRITFKDVDGNKEHYQIPLSDLPSHLQDAYQSVNDLLQEGDFGTLPVSPIDWLRMRIEEAGYSVAEITGRTTTIDYTQPIPTLSKRDRRERGAAGKKQTLKKYNSGDLDVVIFNRSGSTGVSMHASETFKDKRMRRMFIMQAEGNVDTHLQVLGRVNRTGQVVLPAYDHIMAEVPAEVRPAAVTMKKMASLNANTTGARGGVFMTSDLDFLNEVGDQVVVDALKGDPTLNFKLGNAVKLADKGYIVEDAATKATGKLMLMEIEEQEAFLDEVRENYAAEIKRLDALGENALEAKSLDLQAETLGVTEVKPATGSGPFEAAVNMEEISAKAQGRAYSLPDIAQEIAKTIKAPKPKGGAEAMASLQDQGGKWAQDLIAKTRGQAETWLAQEAKDVGEGNGGAVIRRHRMVLQRWENIVEGAYPGLQVRLQMPEEAISGIVTEIKKVNQTKSPMALGSWHVTIAVPRSERVFTFPMSKLYTAQHPRGDEKGAELIFHRDRPWTDLEAEYDLARKEGREVRYMMTGNILAGYDQTSGKGQIVNYTTKDGKVHPGVLMSRRFDAGDFMGKRKVRFRSAEAITEFMDQSTYAEVVSDDQYITLLQSRGTWVIQMNAGRQKGGRYFTDEAVRSAMGDREFQKSGKLMKTWLDKPTFEKVTAELIKLKALFYTQTDQDVAQEIVNKDQKKAAPQKASQDGSVKRLDGKITIDDFVGMVEAAKQGKKPEKPLAAIGNIAIPDAVFDIDSDAFEGSRLKTIAQAVRQFNQEAKQFISLAEKAVDVEVSENIEEIERLASSMDDLAGLLDQGSKEGYAVAEKLDELKDTVENEFDTIIAAFEDDIAYSAASEEAEFYLEELNENYEERFADRDEDEADAVTPSKDRDDIVAEYLKTEPTGKNVLDLARNEQAALDKVVDKLTDRLNKIYPSDYEEMSDSEFEAHYDDVADIAIDFAHIRRFVSESENSFVARFTAAQRKVVDGLEAISDRVVEPKASEMEWHAEDLRYEAEVYREEAAVRRRELSGKKASIAAIGSRTRRFIETRLKSGHKVNIEPSTVSKVLKTLKPLEKMLPNRGKIYALSSLEPIENGQVRATFVSKTGRIKKKVGSYQAFSSARAFYDPLSGSALILRFNSADVGVNTFTDSVRAELGHEATHALFRQDLISVRDARRLVRHGKNLRILDGAFQTYLRIVGDDGWKSVDPEITVRQAYSQYYAGRDNLQALLDEEGATHLVEWYMRGELSDEEVAPVKDILDEILSGRMAQGDDVSALSSLRDISERIDSPVVSSSGASLAIQALHGSNSDFTKFNSDLIQSGLLKWGVNTTTSARLAKRFAQNRGRNGDLNEATPESGYVYSIEVPFEKEDLLQWHLTAKDQSAHVVRSIKKAAKSLEKDGHKTASDALRRYLSGRSSVVDKIKTTIAQPVLKPGEHSLMAAFDAIEAAKGGARKASEFLAENGIPGISYAVFNNDVHYVFFNPDTVEIVNRQLGDSVTLAAIGSGPLDVSLKARKKRAEEQGLDTSGVFSDFENAPTTFDEKSSFQEPYELQQWEDMSRNAHNMMIAIEKKNTFPVRRQDVPRSDLEVQATSLEKEVRDFEETLRRSKKSDVEISQSISEKFGFPVDVDDLKKGNVWWQIERDNPFSLFWTLDRLEKIKSLSKAGTSNEDIAKWASSEYGRPITSNAIQQQFKLAGFLPGESKTLSQRWPRSVVSEVIWATSEGEKASSIADRLSYMTGAKYTEELIKRHVSMITNAMGLRTILNGKPYEGRITSWSKPMILDVIDGQKKGLSYDEIALTINSKNGTEKTRQAVGSIVRKLKVMESIDGIPVRRPVSDNASDLLAAIGAPYPDIDPVGFYSKALRVAKSLKQETMTLEQARAAFKGVSEAEIEATRLDELFQSDVESRANDGAVIKSPEQISDVMISAANEALAEKIDYDIQSPVDFDEALVDATLQRLEDGFYWEASALAVAPIEPSVIKSNGKYDVVAWNDLSKEQKEAFSNFNPGYLPEWLSENDIEVSLDNYDPDNLEDSSLDLMLVDNKKTKDAFIAHEKKALEVKSVEDIYEHPDWHVGATAFKAWLDVNQIPYQSPNQFTTVNSIYFYVNIKDEVESDNLDDWVYAEAVKVRFSDHWQQSGLHLNADYNIVSEKGGGLDAGEFKKTIADITKARKARPEDMGFADVVKRDGKPIGDRPNAGTPKSPRVNQITKQEIIKHLEDNRVEVRESVYGYHNKKRAIIGRQPRWAEYSVDPTNPTYTNPTYKETVLHLPSNSSFAGAKADVSDFASGHFFEPNIIVHNRTEELIDSQGKKVLNGTEIQSDWGQKLRDDQRNGVSQKLFGKPHDNLKDAEKLKVTQYIKDNPDDIPLGRNEAKIAKLSNEKTEIEGRLSEFDISRETRENLMAEELNEFYPEATKDISRLDLVGAELRTAEASVSGYPLVNTTDQWVNTGLKKLITQAVESGADKISIPSGETVIGYRMGGKPDGLKYAYNEMYPKKLHKLLRKIDPSIKPERVATLDSPSGEKGLGEGFTVFPITDQVRDHVVQNGFPLFGSVEKMGQLASALSNMEAGERSALKSEVEDAVNIVNQIAGPGVKVVLRQEIEAGEVLSADQAASLREAGVKVSEYANGYYRQNHIDGSAVIGLALNNLTFDIEDNALHEAFHHVVEQMAGSSEVAMLRSEVNVANMRRLAAAELNMTDEEAKGIPLREVETYAFQRWARDERQGGIHIAVRRLFARIARMLRSVKAVLQGREIETYQDFFAKALAGEFVSDTESSADVEESTPVTPLPDVDPALPLYDGDGARIPFLERIRSRIDEARFGDELVAFDNVEFLNLQDASKVFGISSTFEFENAVIADGPANEDLAPPDLYEQEVARQRGNPDHRPLSRDDGPVVQLRKEIREIEGRMSRDDAALTEGRSEALKALKKTIRSVLYKTPIKTRLGLSGTIQRRHGTSEIDKGLASHVITKAADGADSFKRTVELEKAVALFPKLEVLAKDVWKFDERSQRVVNDNQSTIDIYYDGRGPMSEDEAAEVLFARMTEVNQEAMEADGYGDPKSQYSSGVYAAFAEQWRKVLGLGHDHSPSEGLGPEFQRWWRRGYRDAQKHILDLRIEKKGVEVNVHELEAKRQALEVLEGLRTFSLVRNPENDPGLFFNDMFEPSDGGSITVTAAYETYLEWAELRRLAPVSIQEFNKAARQDGLNQVMIAGSVRFTGVHLKNLSDINASVLSPNTQPGQSPARTAMQRRADRMLKVVRQRTDPLRIKIQDKVLPIRRIQEVIEEATGREMPVTINTYMAEAIFQGRAPERLVDLERDFIEPLVDTLRSGDVTMEDLGEYVYARHAEERNAKIATMYEADHDFSLALLNPDIVGGSGMSARQAGAIQARVRDSGKLQIFEEAAALVDRMQGKTLRTLYTSGVIDEETFNEWSSSYANYVPLRGFEIQDEDSFDGAGTGFGLDVRGTGVKQALGRYSKADNPVAYALSQAMDAIVRSEKNKVTKTFKRMVEANPNPSLWKVYKGTYVRKLNEETGLVEKRFVPPPGVNSEKLIGVRVAGKQHYIEIKDTGLLRAMRGVGSEVLGSAVGRTLAKLTRIYAQLLTSWNPEFPVGNFFRDLETALFNIGDIQDKPEHIRYTIAKEALSLKSIRGIMRALRHDDRSTEMAALFEKFRMAGGKISFMDYNNIEQIKNRINSRLTSGRIKDAARDVFRYIEDLNTAIENGVRLSVFKALTEHGVPVEKAAFISRELTVNFNRKGEWGPAINSMYIFFNATVQGSTRIIQAATRSKVVRRALAATVAAGFSLEMMNALFLAGDDDETGKNAYDRIPDWVKERNLVIMNPFRNDPNDYIMFPMAYGFNVPYFAGQQLGAMMRRKKDPTEAAASIIWATVDSFNPVGTSVSFWQAAAPTFLDPGVQMLENKTWFGGRIYPTKFDDRKPDSENYFSSVNENFVEVARLINETTGGSRGRPGSLLGMDTSYSPETLEHYVEFIGGGLSKFVVRSMTFGERFVDGEEWLPEKTPFIRRFYNKSTSTSLRREFYDAWDAVDQAHYEVKKLKEDKLTDMLESRREEFGAELQSYGSFKSTVKTLKAMRKGRVAIESSKQFSDVEKRERLDAIVEKENKVIARALKRYNKAKEK